MGDFFEKKFFGGYLSVTAQSLNLQPYDMDLINKIPFKYYLAVAFRHQELYDPLGDILGRLMLEVLPQMRTVYDDMQSGFFEEETDKQPIFLTEGKFFSGFSSLRFFQPHVSLFPLICFPLVFSPRPDGIHVPLPR